MMPELAPTMTDRIAVSKFLSLVLRHKPEEIGLVLDAHGWAEVEELIRLANQYGKLLTPELLRQVVVESDKQRFAFSADGQSIRASQGHSLEIDLGLAPSEPPELLYHGTATRFLESIRAGGLHSAGRRHVHLSPDRETGHRVGRRHGKPVILAIRAGAMRAAGKVFFLSDNGVWLTDHVPVAFIDFPSSPSSACPS